MPAPRLAQLGPLDRFLGSPLVAALTSPRHVDAYLELVSPVWSLSECRARIEAIRRETTDMVTLVLAPNALFTRHSAGEWVSLTATIDGVRHSRCFSLSSAPSQDGTVTVTMRVHPDGVVSRWAAERAKVGDVVVLSAPQGDFVLPEPLPSRVLLVSGGSGITPCMAILRDVIARSLPVEVTFLHFARTYEDVPFLSELRSVNERSPNVRVVLALTREAALPGDHEGHLDARLLAEVAAGAEAGHVFVCGPAGLVDAVSAHYAALAPEGRLHVERFTAPPRTRLEPPNEGAPRRVAFTRSGVIASSDGRRSLLLEAESAGLSPKHGCRMGICQSCRCTKTSGVVRDDLTGDLLDESITDIRLCVSTPVTDTTLDL